MNPILEGLLRLEHGEGLVLSAEPGSGALENMRIVSLPRSAAVTKQELRSFLQVVLERRRTLAAGAAFPVTFYVWHDEAAGQLRLSTAHCAPETLPFGALLELVEDPNSILDEFLSSACRDGIPWGELTEVSWDDTEDPPPPPLKVWAVPLATSGRRSEKNPI